ncbi:MAG: hypothetical protein Q9190_006119 [Brigantiaea leucoxantha]
MRGADRVLVNSGFTKGVVERVWPEVFGGEAGMKELGIVYPCVDTREKGEEEEGRGPGLWKGKRVVLSINRFERKKNVGLAIQAFSRLGAEERRKARLVIAGGYDIRVRENVMYHEELVALAEKELGLHTATMNNLVTALNVPDEIEVLFLLDVRSKLKSMLLSSARLLVYTPTNEHFGIVPLEAMLAGVPVLAANSGGPLETVLEGKTGWLRSAEDEDQWMDVMHQALYRMRDEDVKKMGEMGKGWVKSEFSETKMAQRLNEEIDAMVASPRQPAVEIPDLLLGVGIFGMVSVAILVLAIRLSR